MFMSQSVALTDENETMPHYLRGLERLAPINPIDSIVQPKPISVGLRRGLLYVRTLTNINWFQETFGAW